MNEQQNQFFGNDPQFGQPEGQGQSPQFGQPEMQPQQFGQPEVQPQQQFGQPEVQPQQQFGQPEVQAQQQFGQPEMQPQQQFGQPEGQQFTQQNFAPNGFEVPQKSNKKKALTITALVLAVLVLIGGTTVGVWAVMSGGKFGGSTTGQSAKDAKSSAAGNVFQYLNKISQAKKVEGKFNAEGEVAVKSYGETMKAKLGVKSGEVHVERTEGNTTPDKFFSLSGTITASSDSTDSQTKRAVKMLDGEKFDVSLSGDLVFKWSFMGQTDRQSLYGDNKKQVQALFTVNKENEEAARELRDFLLKGYEFKVSKDGDMTVLTLNKDDLKAMAKKMEENVKNDEKKFKELYFKSSKEASEKIYESIIDGFLEKQLSKTVEEQVLPNLNEFEYKISYKDSGDRIQEKSELKLDFAASGTYKAKISLNAETTYTL